MVQLTAVKKKTAQKQQYIKKCSVNDIIAQSRRQHQRRDRSSNELLKNTRATDGTTNDRVFTQDEFMVIIELLNPRKHHDQTELKEKF